MNTTDKKYSRALRAAFPNTIPVLTGFLFLGIAYGFLMKSSGFPLWVPILMSIVVYAGSMQFVACNLLLGIFDPLQAFLLTLMINARHLFYGISMLEKYKGAGILKFFLIFGMSDETFSVNYTAKIPEDVDSKHFYLSVTLLDQLYWLTGTTLGAIFGSFLTINTEGLDFVMTAMFVVIFLEQWLKDKNHLPALLGLGLSALCLFIFGKDSFILPTMGVLLLSLTAVRKPLEKEGK